MPKTSATRDDPEVGAVPSLPNTVRKFVQQAVEEMAPEIARRQMINERERIVDEVLRRIGDVRQEVRYFGGNVNIPTLLSENITFTQSGIGAVATDIQTDGRTSKKLTQWMTAAQIADAEAGTRSIDCSAALQAAITHCITKNFDLEVPYQVLLSSAVNIDRQVDGAAYDKYFRIWSGTGGGFYTTALATGLFTSSIAFTTAPVSQLVFFDGLNFESDAAATRYVLNNGRFLRTRFNKCTFDKILCVNSTIYTQSIQFTNCNMRRGSGTFWTSIAQSYDFKFIGNIWEAWTGDGLHLAIPIGGSIIGNLFEGLTGTPIVYNGANGLAIHGNYFEANGKDIDGTGANVAYGVHIAGNYFSHANSADYSVIWGAGGQLACVSEGNYHNGSMHNVSSGADVFIRDIAATSIQNNPTTPVIPDSSLELKTAGSKLAVGVSPIVVGTAQVHASANATLALTDAVLGSNYGGAIRGYGVGGQGGYVELGGYDAGTYSAKLIINQLGQAQFTGSGAALEVGSPTGGFKAAGTANFAADIYKNGTAYTNPDYVLEHWATGKIVKYADKEGASKYKGRMSLDRLRAYIKKHWHLPGFGQKAKHGAFGGADMLLARVEELTLYILDLHDRIKELERRK